MVAPVEEAIENVTSLGNASLSIGDQWLEPGTDFLRRTRQRRSTADQVAAFSQPDNFIDCEDGGQCANGACASDTCKWNPAGSGSKLGTRQVSGVNPTRPCVNVVPAMMYNCRYFPDEWKGGRVWPGICNNILTWLRKQGRGSGPFEGTYSMTGEPGDTNREDVCGRRSSHPWSIIDHNGLPKTGKTTWAKRCGNHESVVLATLVGGTKGPNGNYNYLSCDEFPFNSFEEGGDKLTNSRMCVTWTDLIGTTRTEWMPWTDDWTDSAATGPGGWNQGGTYKKSLSFHLFNSQSTMTPLNTKYQVFNHKLIPGQGSEDRIINVLGAINLLGNSKYRMTMNENAYCSTSLPLMHPKWQTANGLYVRVRGRLDNTAATKKLKRGEQPTVEELFNIKSGELNDEDPGIDLFLPDEAAENVEPVVNNARDLRHDAHARSHIARSRGHH
ncbi:hypothetical protein BDV12DRAFT_205134 [Aspergillus spectabilis]